MVNSIVPNVLPFLTDGDGGISVVYSDKDDHVNDDDEYNSDSDDDDNDDGDDDDENEIDYDDSDHY